jgi:tetratricopeptide (TPR) repeat protein
VIAAFPELDSGYSARGDSYAALGGYELAIADYSTALELTPTFVSVVYMRGRAHAALEQWSMAASDYENAIEQMPEYELPYWGLGDLYYTLGDPQRALAHYQQYLALATEPPSAELLARVDQLIIVAAEDTV